MAEHELIFNVPGGVLLILVVLNAAAQAILNAFDVPRACHDIPAFKDISAGRSSCHDSTTI